jgi:regulator of RNase E activity RraA
MIDAAIRREMQGFDTCILSDALEKLGLPCGLAVIRRLTTRRRIFGACVTVLVEKFRGDVPKKHLGARAIEAASPGDVIVMSHRSRDDCAGWGGLLSTSAALRGISGIVVDGIVRDVDESEDLGFPVFARGATPVTARNRVIETSTNEPITVEGIRVAPGDYVLADGSGVVFIPKDRFGEVLATTRKLLEFEDGVRAAVSAGRQIGEVMNQNYETLLKRAKP